VSTSQKKFLEIKGITHYYTENKNKMFAIDNVSLNVADGEFVTVVGPSGCGKSTLFNIIAGLIKPSKGQIILNGNDITETKGHVGYMLQRDLLLPWRSVLNNVILGLEIQGVNKKESIKEAKELLTRFGLEAFMDKLPHTLSGGMRQKCAFIRTLLSRKETLLLDEPLGALDAQTRLLMQEWLLDVWGQFKKTVFFITHDIEEAVFLSDRVYVLTSRPSKVIEEIVIDLERPRNSSTRLNEKFAIYRENILNMIRNESIKSFESNN